MGLDPKIPPREARLTRRGMLQDADLACPSAELSQRWFGFARSVDSGYECLRTTEPFFLP